MKKLSVFSILTVTGLSLFITSCTTKKNLNQKNPSSKMTLSEQIEINDDVTEEMSKSAEYTHEMAEADADDQIIKKEVGDAEIDKELPGSEDDKVPYAKNFLALKKTKRMQFWVDYFTKQNHERFQRFINNGEEYRQIIERVFEAQGLPKELYFVGLIESGYYLGAKSHASAVGPWQFIRGTGKRYGLKITPELDERQDLFKASRAAAMYFKDLHNVFSSWELALSAYNAGEYGIIRRIMKHGTRDFYELSQKKQLPSETINYVPKVLAAMHIVKNAEKYGFVIPKKKHRLFDMTELRPAARNVPLSVIANRLNVSTNLLKKLNPELRRNSTPRNFSGTYYLRVPQSRYATQEIGPQSGLNVTKIGKPESRKELNRRTAFIDSTISSVITNEIRPLVHRVRNGETLFSISRKYNITPRELARLNDFKTWNTKLQLGQKIKLGAENFQKVATASRNSKVKMTNRPLTYKVRQGDNLMDIAKLFDIKLSKIKKANNLQKSKVLVGQKIILPDTRKGIYTVRKGDHLTKVARDLKQPIETLIKLNSLKRGAIYPGQKIIVNMD